MRLSTKIILGLLLVAIIIYLVKKKAASDKPKISIPMTQKEIETYRKQERELTPTEKARLKYPDFYIVSDWINKILGLKQQ